ncbi:hypothetical protein JZU46_00190 [bacterium]|nr:hypothetical protein [bacterium]
MTRSVGRPKSPPKARELLKNIIPVEDMFSETELGIYNNLVDVYLKDFDEDDLTSSDIDDLMNLSVNKVLEVRLLTSSKNNSNDHLNISTSLEKLRKHSDKIKENLASRRKDRIDPNEFKGFSIVDLTVAFDDAKKLKLENKARDMKLEQESLIESLEENSCKDTED